MSASREKKVRKEGFANESAHQLNEQKAKKARTRKNVLIGVAITLVVVLIIGSIVLFEGPYFRRNSVAVTTGTHELSPAMVRYFYYDAYSEFYQGYGSMLGMLYAGGSNFDEEIYDESTGETWGDLMMDTALENIRTTYAVYDDAMANGYTLSEEGENSLSSTETMISLYAEMSGVTENDYIRATYGNGSDFDSFMEYQRILTTVSYYEQETQDSFTYTDTEIQEAYEAAPEDYDVFTYHSYLVRAETDSDSEEADTGSTEETDADSTEETDNTAAMAEAQETAENMAEESEGNLDRYLELCNELSDSDTYTDGTASLRENYSSSSMSDNIKSWITDPVRQEGDTAALEYPDNGYYVLYFVSRSDNDYDALNLRSIEISASTTDDEGNTTLDWDAAEERLNAFQEEFEAAEDPLTALDTLASTYSDDSATSASGGAYETVHRGQFESAVDEWLFGESHESGDTTVIQGEDAYYFLYIEGSAGNYRDYLVDQALRAEDYTKWLDSVTADATVETQDFGMRHVLRTLTVQSTQ